MTRPISEIPDFPYTEDPLDLDDPAQPWLRSPALLEEFHRMASATIAVDFDGVLHPYTNGWTGSAPDDEPPIDGAREFLARLRDLGFTVVVFSTRADHPEGHAGITRWLDEHGLLQYVERVTAGKPAAVAYVDDRAVPYTGAWGATLAGVRHLATGRAHGAAPAPPGATDADRRDRLVTAILGKLRAPDGDAALTAFDFASIGEIAQEIADAVEQLA